ncbi:hypothetical protein N7467_002630 [Penicillium canescens]|nr:hypothetical protein N7467_002630 [Penicillium canescens]
MMLPFRACYRVPAKQMSSQVAVRRDAWGAGSEHSGDAGEADVKSSRSPQRRVMLEASTAQMQERWPSTHDDARATRVERQEDR